MVFDIWEKIPDFFRTVMIIRCLLQEISFDYRQIEGKVVEISRLQEIFADKVLEQVHIAIVVTVALVLYTFGGIISTLDFR